MSQVRGLEADNRSLREDLGFFEKLLPVARTEGLAIRSVQAGQLFLPACMAAELWQAGNGKAETVQASRPLSEQETKVLTLIARGFSNAEIAEELLISVKTVETYKARLLEKRSAHHERPGRGKHRAHAADQAGQHKQQRHGATDQQAAQQVVLPAEGKEGKGQGHGKSLGSEV